MEFVWFGLLWTPLFALGLAASCCALVNAGGFHEFTRGWAACGLRRDQNIGCFRIRRDGHPSINRDLCTPIVKIL